MLVNLMKCNGPFPNSWSRWTTENAHCNEHTWRFFTQITGASASAHESEDIKINFISWWIESATLQSVSVLQTRDSKLFPPDRQNWSSAEVSGCVQKKVSFEVWIMDVSFSWIQVSCFVDLNEVQWAGFKWVLEVDERPNCLMNVLGGFYWITEISTTSICTWWFWRNYYLCAFSLARFS